MVQLVKGIHFKSFFYENTQIGSTFRESNRRVSYFLHQHVTRFCIWLYFTVWSPE